MESVELVPRRPRHRASGRRRAAMLGRHRHARRLHRARRPRHPRRWRRCASTSPASSAWPSAGPLDAAVRVETHAPVRERLRRLSSAAASWPMRSRAFFENGGAGAWWPGSRRRSPETRRGRQPRCTSRGAAWLTLAASSPGSWGNGLAVRSRRPWRAETVAPIPAGGGCCRSRSLATDGFAAGAPGTVEPARQAGPLPHSRRCRSGGAARCISSIPSPRRRRPADAALPGSTPGLPVRDRAAELDPWRSGATGAWSRVYAGAEPGAGPSPLHRRCAGCRVRPPGLRTSALDERRPPPDRRDADRGCAGRG